MLQKLVRDHQVPIHDFAKVQFQNVKFLDRDPPNLGKICIGTVSVRDSLAGHSASGDNKARLRTSTDVKLGN